MEALQLHAKLLKRGLEDHTYRCNLLLQACARYGQTQHAHEILRRMRSPNVVSFNTVLSGHLRHGSPDQALSLFRQMHERDERTWNILVAGFVANRRFYDAAAIFADMCRGRFRPDQITLSSILRSCDLILGRQVHALAIRVCPGADPVLGTSILRMYAEGGEISDAEKVFEDMAERDLVAWNALISGYSKLGMGDHGLRLFREMASEVARIDGFTIAAVLDEIAGRSWIHGGLQIHSLMIKSGLDGDRFCSNSLLNLYSKCCSPIDAEKLFSEILDPDQVSWTLLIGAFSQIGRQDEAMAEFRRMRISDVSPNSFTFGSLLASSFHSAKQLHALILKSGLESDRFAGSSIVDAYSKCGEIEDAMKLFQISPRKDIVSWNGIICGLAQNGESTKAIEIFDSMLKLDEIVPNAVTFVGILSACSHGGRIREGIRYFSEVLPSYLKSPEPEHYAIVVDLLSRAGFLEEAEKVLEASPFEPDAIAWSAILAACRKHGYMAVARRIEGKLGDDRSSQLLQMANICAAGEEWGRASEMRKRMSEEGEEKMPGHSWIEIRGVLHSFRAGLDQQLQNRTSVCHALQSLQRYSASLALSST